jgi:hypothetical protein
MRDFVNFIITVTLGYYVLILCIFVIKTVLHGCLLKMCVKIFYANSVPYGLLDICFPGLLQFPCARIGYFLVL